MFIIILLATFCDSTGASASRLDAIVEMVSSTALIKQTVYKYDLLRLWILEIIPAIFLRRFYFQKRSVAAGAPLKSEPFFPWQTFQRVVKYLEQRDEGETHTETEQAPSVGYEVDYGRLLVPPDVGDHRLLDVNIHHGQVVLSVDIQDILHILYPDVFVSAILLSTPSQTRTTH